MVVGYDDRLTSELLPKIVQPVYSTATSPETVLAPPLKLSDKEVLDAVVVSAKQFAQLETEGQVTRLPTLIPARPGYRLWIDEAFQAQYGPEKDVRRILNDFANQKIQSGIRSLKNRDYSAAERDMQAALNADRSSLSPVYLAAAIRGATGQSRHLPALKLLASSIEPGKDKEVESWYEFGESFSPAKSRAVWSRITDAFYAAVERLIQWLQWLRRITGWKYVRDAIHAKRLPRPTEGKNIRDAVQDAARWSEPRRLQRAESRARVFHEAWPVDEVDRRKFLQRCRESSEVIIEDEAEWRALGAEPWAYVVPEAIEFRERRGRLSAMLQMLDVVRSLHRQLSKLPPAVKQSAEKLFETNALETNTGFKGFARAQIVHQKSAEKPLKNGNGLGHLAHAQVAQQSQN